MKKIILCLFLFLFVQCHKEEVVPLYYKYIYGEVSGIKLNGIAWPDHLDWKTRVSGQKTIPTSNCNVSLGLIRIETLTNENYLREQFGIGQIPLKVGKYLLTDNDIRKDCDTLPGAGLTLSEGDAGVGDYLRLQSVESSITVTSYDSISGDVRGTFDVTFIKMNKASEFYKNYTDTVRFNGGQFHTRWIK